MTERRTILVGDTELELKIVRKRVKNVNARLVGQELRVSAPPQIPGAELDKIVHDLARRLLRRVRSRQINADGSALELARRIATRFPDPVEIEDVRYDTVQRSRWGSYSLRTRTIRINAALRQMPSWVLESVIAHELAHTVHADHSPAFWALARKVCPATDRANAFLDGVTWLAHHLDDLPAVERAQLIGKD